MWSLPGIVYSCGFVVVVGGVIVVVALSVTGANESEEISTVEESLGSFAIWTRPVIWTASVDRPRVSNFLFDNSCQKEM
jgi:hypothetical protein